MTSSLVIRVGGLEGSNVPRRALGASISIPPVELVPPGQASPEVQVLAALVWIRFAARSLAASDACVGVDSPTSLHDQPGYHQNQQQQQQQPQAAGQASATSKKRSAQKIIKGLFSGRGHDSHRDQQNPSSSASYDNTVGLARRPSKRVSTLSQQQQQQPPPNLKTGLAVSDRDWHSHTPSSSVHQTSPLQGVGEAEEYYAADQYHDLQQQHQQQPDLRIDPRHSAHDQASNVALPPSQPANQQQISQPAMAPPGGGGVPTNRRPADAEKALPGAPPGYRHTHTNSNNLNAPGASLQPGQQPASSTGGAAAASGAAAGAGAAAAGAPPRYEAATGDQGRNSPQPSTHERDSTESDKAFKELLTKYKNVKRLYFDGKSQIEQLNGQVEHLQNAVANQRMSQSRTALDDNEYVNRFNRLNGAINNLAFNIRKDWRRLPQWLENYVSPDALKTGKQEMTAVGRAVITKWIVDEVFNKCFHPDLDAALSAQLKEIELNIRGNAYTMHSQEEFDALTTKVVNWRMATLDGLQQKLSSSAAADNRASLITKTQTNLTAHLYQFLIEPPPAGVDGSTSMIMELAVGIAANMPRESRDVTIQYPLPGDVLQAGVMDVEKTPLPPLDGQKEGESSKPDSDADKDKSSSSGDSSKAGFAKDASRVRFAGFVALEVRGRQVLVKAPVWAM
ncbi:hypothetical protein TGAM01_v205704 [Trichoderma gamsii]|uniref:S-adenosylmethionine-dependent methyltransferase-like protein n=1 Tax=Trichoderma gamsii TaxID=398673 RepID=A0A2P4ZMA5_9HYPO|nr:hypothetical protein TGAM01_v205704 [Trichoderma gamsii]PON25410.1 hypothetical protein TGAM01_v205704 [Trichoderma gamsii]